MNSRVAILAKDKGIKNPSDLHWAAKISWPVARKIWDGDISNMRIDTCRKVAAAIGCSIDELYIYTNAKEKAAP